MTIIYSTMCRFVDFNFLKVKHFVFHDTHVEVTFPSSKNDQFFEGSKSIIAIQSDNDTCPVKIIKLYFDMFHLWRNPEFYLNFRLYSKSWRVQGRFRLTYSNAVSNVKKLLSKHDIKIKYSEKSCKTAAVTKALQNGISIEDLMLHGRWRSLNTPFHYRNTEKTYKLQIAVKLFQS